jgi:hypothetical protein
MLIMACSSLLMLTTLLFSCSSQSPPPSLKAEDIQSIQIFLRDETTNALSSVAYLQKMEGELKRFAEAWNTLESLRQTRPQPVDGLLHIEAELVSGVRWELNWRPRPMPDGDDLLEITRHPGELEHWGPRRVKSATMSNLLMEWAESAESKMPGP